MTEQYTTVEGWHTAADGQKLYTKRWKPTGPVKARVVFVHGFSDHCNAYNQFFPNLASRGIEVFSWDQRGWGLSVHKPSDKGKTGSTHQVLSDISSILSSPVLAPRSPPLFLMGHSMGGAEVLTYASAGPAAIRARIRGYLAESPFCAVAPPSRPAAVTVFAGRIAAHFVPNWHMVNELDVSLLSRDPAVGEQFRNDELCHDTGTLEGLAGMLDRAANLELGRVTLKGEAAVGKSLWVAHGDADGICDFDVTKRWVEGAQVEDKEFKAYHGWYHRLHSEPSPDRETYLNDVVEWIFARLS